jgi:hypothetical protein
MKKTKIKTLLTNKLKTSNNTQAPYLINYLELLVKLKTLTVQQPPILIYLLYKISQIMF